MKKKIGILMLMLMLLGPVAIGVVRNDPEAIEMMELSFIICLSWYLVKIAVCLVNGDSVKNTFSHI